MGGVELKFSIRDGVLLALAPVIKKNKLRKIKYFFILLALTQYIVAKATVSFKETYFCHPAA